MILQASLLAILPVSSILVRYYLICCLNCRIGCFHKQRQTNIFYFLHSISIRYNTCITNGFTALITSVAGCGWPSLGGLALLFQPVTIYSPSPFTRPQVGRFPCHRRVIRNTPLHISTHRRITLRLVVMLQPGCAP